MKTLLLAILIPFALAQTQQTTIVPACTLNFTLAAAGSSPVFANSNPNLSCDEWTLTVYNVGFSGFSLTLQSAPAATFSTPGTFITYPGTVATGTNPVTATGIATFTNGTVATPYLRVTLSGLTGTGTVYGVLQGSQTVLGKSGGGGGGGGGAVTPGVIGTAIPVNISASGLTQILAASGSNTTTLYHLSLSFSSGVNVQIEYGTGTNCGTGTTALTGVYQALAGIALDLDSFVKVQIPAGQALCINLGSSVAGGGLLVYTQP